MHHLKKVQNIHAVQAHLQVDQDPHLHVPQKEDHLEARDRYREIEDAIVHVAEVMSEETIIDQDQKIKDRNHHLIIQKQLKSILVD